MHSFGKVFLAKPLAAGAHALGTTPPRGGGLAEADAGTVEAVGDNSSITGVYAIKVL